MCKKLEAAGLGTCANDILSVQAKQGEPRDGVAQFNGSKFLGFYSEASRRLALRFILRNQKIF